MGDETSPIKEVAKSTGRAGWRDVFPPGQWLPACRPRSLTLVLAIGPTSAVSMLVGVTVADMAGGDPARFASIAALTAILFAAMCLVAWILRLSSLVDFIRSTSAHLRAAAHARHGAS